MPLVDPVARKSYLAQYYLLHKDKIKNRSKTWYRNNPEKAKARIKQWVYEHPDKVREFKRRNGSKPKNKIRIRRLKMLRRSIERISEIELKKIFSWEQEWRSKDSVKCYWCRNYFHPSDCHTDHVIPLSRLGKHELSNVVISCAQCNRKKGCKHPTDWAIQLNREIGRELDILWC